MSATALASNARMEQSLILSVDFEDWNQLVRRRVGDPTWDAPRPALARQTAALLETLSSIPARATFFVLGITARRYPELVRAIAEGGHELACHGLEHRRVYDGDSAELREDLERSIELIAEQCGRRPIGYRAPAFSINRTTPWAYEVLADLGFAYDSSQYDSPRIPGRIRPVPAAPFRLALESGRSLWELPVAAWRLRSRAVPVGGGAYWRVLPSRALMRGLRSVASAGPAALYIHPYECDPEPLRAGLPASAPLARRAHARMRELQRNPGRSRVLAHLRAVGHHFHLLTCEQAYEQFSRSPDEGQRALPRERQVV